MTNANPSLSFEKTKDRPKGACGITHAPFGFATKSGKEGLAVREKTRIKKERGYKIYL